jgi:phage I-like protein
VSKQKIPIGRLIALRAPVAIDPKAEPPSRLVMLKWGDNATTKGNFRVGQRTLESLSNIQRQSGFDEVVLDFEHNTVPNHPSNKGEPAAIAARAKPVVVENEGLIFDSLSWTEPGKQYREHYHDLSPVVAKDENDDVIFIHSGALCRNGAAFDLHAFNAQINLKTFALTPFENPASPMVVSASQVDLDLLRKVLSLSTLSADASVEDINKALVELANMPDERASDQGNNALNAVIKGLGVALVTLTGEVKKIRDSAEKTERNQILAEAIREGKVVPKKFQDGSMSNDQLRALVADLPEIVPMEKRTPEHIESLSAIRTINSTDDQVRKTLGISEEKWNAHPLPTGAN